MLTHLNLSGTECPLDLVSTVEFYPRYCIALFIMYRTISVQPSRQALINPGISRLQAQNLLLTIAVASMYTGLAI